MGILSFLGFGGSSSPPPEDAGRYSIGTTPAVDTLLKIVEKQPDHERVIMVNLMTILRNRLTKDQRINDLVKLVKSDVDLLRTELTTILAPGNRQKILILYTMSYERQLPPTLLRTDDQQRALVKTATILLRETIKTEAVTDGKLAIFVVHSDTTRMAHMAIREAIHKLPVVKPTVQIISHIPLDYHIFEFFSGSLIKSYTGEELQGDRKTIGMYVFKKDNLPFCVPLHMLYGDKVVVKGSIGIKEKRQIEAVAATEMWYLRTPSWIVESLTKLKIKIPLK